MKSHSDNSLWTVRLAYAGTLLVWLAASFIPAFRVWGVGFLSPLGWVERIFFLALAVALYLCFEHPSAGWWKKDSPREAVDVWQVWAAAGLFLVLFLILHGRTHFLGDSAAALSSLPNARLRGGFEFSLAVPLLQAAQAWWGEGTSALRAYQLVSIASGVLCVLVALHFARRIFDSRVKAWVFVAGQLSAGYMLVFFGYVENHALLVLAALAFTAAGIALCRQRAGLLWIVVSFALAVAFHPLGWCLLPALVYLTLKHSPLKPGWQGLPRWARAAVVLALFALAVLLIQRQYAGDYAFRIALLSLFKSRLTVDGYTLFSAAHAADLVNLVLLLFPGLAVALAFFQSNRGAKRRRDPAAAFLLWTLGGAWITVVVLDPSLGMPRAWDRFALAGVPLASWVYYRLLAGENPRAVATALLCTSLAVCALLSRAWVQARPEPSVKLAMSYFKLDPGRSRTGVLTVGKYLLDHNTTAIYGELEDFRRANYPEEGLRERLNFLFRDKKQLEAADVCQLMIRHDPRFAAAWMFLGFIYNNAARFDSAAAYLVVANGLDRHNTGILNELGRAYYFSGATERAVSLWNESLHEDSLQYVPHLALATWNKTRGNATEASRHLALASTRPGAPGDTFLELARDHFESGRVSEARAAFGEALAREADSAKAAQLLQSHPELATASPGSTN